jgi:citrate lyase beta subunit
VINLDLEDSVAPDDKAAGAPNIVEAIGASTGATRR